MALADEIVASPTPLGVTAVTTPKSMVSFLHDFLTPIDFHQPDIDTQTLIENLSSPMSTMARWVFESMIAVKNVLCTINILSFKAYDHCQTLYDL